MCAYLIYHKRTHDTELYAFLEACYLTTLSVRLYSIGGMVLTGEG